MHGVFNSVAGVGGAVTDTVSMLTFDDEYQMNRKRSKNKAMADQGGVGTGFIQVAVGRSTEFVPRHDVKLLCYIRSGNVFALGQHMRFPLCP